MIYKKSVYTIDNTSDVAPYDIAEGSIIRSSSGTKEWTITAKWPKGEAFSSQAYWSISDDIRDTVDQNELGISLNTSAISINIGKIATNTSNIATNTSNISTNTSDISTNTGNISQNTSDISQNTSDISQNTSDITTKVNISDLADYGVPLLVCNISCDGVNTPTLEDKKGIEGSLWSVTSGTSAGLNLTRDGSVVLYSSYIVTFGTISDSDTTAISLALGELTSFPRLVFKDASGNNIDYTSFSGDIPMVIYKK